MKRLLIVYHTQFGGTAQMAEAAARGARQIDDVETIAEARRRRRHRRPARGATRCSSRRRRISARSPAWSRTFSSASTTRARARSRASPTPCSSARATTAPAPCCRRDRIATGLRLRKVHPGTIYRSGLIAQAHEVPDATLAHVRRDRRHARGRTFGRHLLTSPPTSSAVAGASRSCRCSDQRRRWPLDRGRASAIEPVRTAVIRIGHLAHAEFRRELEEQPEVAAKSGGRSAGRARVRFASSIARIQSKRAKSGGRICRAAQRREVVAAVTRGQDGTLSGGGPRASRPVPAEST